MSYKAGIVDAISELKDRTGSSMIAIKKLMMSKIPADKKWQNATFLQSLKAGVAAGDFVKVKASYKLSQDYKKKAVAAEKKAAAPPKAKKVKKVTKAAPKKNDCHHQDCPKKKATVS
jgi:histone H1/5